MLYLQEYTYTHIKQRGKRDRMSSSLCISTKAGGLRWCVGFFICTLQQKHTEAIREFLVNANNHRHTAQLPYSENRTDAVSAI